MIIQLLIGEKHNKIILITLIIFILLGLTNCKKDETLQENKSLPVKVMVAEISRQNFVPILELVGTVDYPDISNVSAETNGIVEKLYFSEGSQVKKGQVILQLNSELLAKQVQTAQNEMEEFEIELKKENWDLERYEKLFRTGDISEKVFNDKKTSQARVEKKFQQLKNIYEKLNIELSRKNILSPFNGVVIQKFTDAGEWISSGSAIASIANNSTVEIIVEAPQDLIKYLNKGKEVDVEINGSRIKGNIFAVISQGNINSRTFPVKIRIPNNSAVLKGMSAKVSIPSDIAGDAFLVLREALVNMSGAQQSIFIVDGGKAVQIPVEVQNYQGLYAVLKPNNLTEGMKVIIKGNIGLAPGAEVTTVVKDSSVQN